MSRRGDILLVVGLLVALLGIAVIAVGGGAAGNGQDALQGSSVSPAPGGALALYRWLDAAGYPVRRVRARTVGRMRCARRTCCLS